VGCPSISAVGEPRRASGSLGRDVMVTSSKEKTALDGLAEEAACVLNDCVTVNADDVDKTMCVMEEGRLETCSTMVGPETNPRPLRIKVKNAIRYVRR
jgi:hypothetical protein